MERFGILLMIAGAALGAFALWAPHSEMVQWSIDPSYYAISPEFGVTQARETGAAVTKLVLAIYGASLFVAGAVFARPHPSEKAQGGTNK